MTGIVVGVVYGALVWAAIGGAFVVWLIATVLWRPLPHAGDAVRWFLGSWLGQFIALGAWAGAGWHIFCQRP